MISVTTGVSQQRGAVLLITLILITILSLVTVAVMETGIMGETMARNEQSRMEVNQRAQSLLDNAIINTANLPFTGAVGTSNCRNMAGCAINTLVVADELITGDHSARSSARITRQAPLLAPPPRAMSSSAGLFQVASFEAQSQYNASAVNQGTATLGQGVMALVNKGSQ